MGATAVFKSIKQSRSTLYLTFLAAAACVALFVTFDAAELLTTPVDVKSLTRPNKNRFRSIRFTVSR
jgi:hypothetical protein